MDLLKKCTYFKEQVDYIDDDKRLLPLSVRVTQVSQFQMFALETVGKTGTINTPVHQPPFEDAGEV